MRERPSLVSRAARTCRPALAAVVPPHAGPDRGRRGEREAGGPAPHRRPARGFLAARPVPQGLDDPARRGRPGERSRPSRGPERLRGMKTAQVPSRRPRTEAGPSPARRPGERVHAPSLRARACPGRRVPLAPFPESRAVGRRGGETRAVPGLRAGACAPGVLDRVPRGPVPPTDGPSEAPPRVGRWLREPRHEEAGEGRAAGGSGAGRGASASLSRTGVQGSTRCSPGHGGSGGGAPPPTPVPAPMGSCPGPVAEPRFRGGGRDRRMSPADGHGHSCGRPWRFVPPDRCRRAARRRLCVSDGVGVLAARGARLLSWGSLSDASWSPTPVREA